EGGIGAKGNGSPRNCFAREPVVSGQFVGTSRRRTVRRGTVRRGISRWGTARREIGRWTTVRREPFVGELVAGEPIAGGPRENRSQARRETGRRPVGRAAPRLRSHLGDSASAGVQRAGHNQRNSRHKEAPGACIPFQWGWELRVFSALCPSGLWFIGGVA